MICITFILDLQWVNIISNGEKYIFYLKMPPLKFQKKYATLWDLHGSHVLSAGPDKKSNYR